MAEKAIEIEKLAFSRNDIAILKNVTTTVERGSCLALLGPSGSGKTTLLRLIAGFIRPTAGMIKIFGNDMQGVPAEMRPVCMLFQQAVLFDEQTVEENALCGLLHRESDHQKARRIVQQLAEVFKLENCLKKKVSTLSGGEKQRAAFIRTFANAKKIMLLDEPIRSAFDLHQRRELMQAIKERTRHDGLTTIIVTHEFEEAAYLADKVLVLVNGKSWSETFRKMYFTPENQNVARVLGYGNEIDAGILLDENRREQMCPLVIDGRFTYYNNAVCAFFRPNDVHVIDNGSGFVIKSVSFAGTFDWVELRAKTSGILIRAMISAKQHQSGNNIDDEVGIRVASKHIIFFDHFGNKVKDGNASISI